LRRKKNGDEAVGKIPAALADNKCEVLVDGEGEDAGNFEEEETVEDTEATEDILREGEGYNTSGSVAMAVTDFSCCNSQRRVRRRESHRIGTYFGQRVLVNRRANIKEVQISTSSLMLSKSACNTG
jgi:hypothetical protein